MINRMMTWAGLLIGVSGMVVCPRATWAAGFEGTIVSMGHYVPQDATPFDGPYDVLVLAAKSDGGSADRTLLSASTNCAPAYGVSVAADSVVVDFVASVNFTAGSPYHGLVIHNLVRPGSTASIVETAPHTTFSYDGSTLDLDWQGQGISAGATYTITFTPGDAGTSAVGQWCSPQPLGICTLCDARPSSVCGGVDGGTSPYGFVSCAGTSADASVGTDSAAASRDSATGDALPTGGTAGAAGTGGAGSGGTGAAGAPGNGGTSSGSAGLASGGSAGYGTGGTSSGSGGSGGRVGEGTGGTGIGGIGGGLDAGSASTGSSGIGTGGVSGSLGGYSTVNTSGGSRAGGGNVGSGTGGAAGSGGGGVPPAGSGGSNTSASEGQPATGGIAGASSTGPSNSNGCSCRMGDGKADDGFATALAMISLMAAVVRRLRKRAGSPAPGSTDR
jgi:MYXO-CTERM domain-containing protein